MTFTNTNTLTSNTLSPNSNSNAIINANLNMSSSIQDEATHSSTYTLTFLHVYEDVQKQQELVEALAQLFVALSRDMQLNVSSIESRGRYVCSVASTRTRAILFGSCPLEVKQKVSVSKHRATIHLAWLHPRPEVATMGLSHVSIGVTKRAHYIQLFNSAWTKKFKAHFLDIVQGGEYAPAIPQRVLREVVEETMRCSFTRVKCDEGVQRELQERFKRDLVLGLTKKSSSSQSRVTFAQTPSIVSLPLTRAEREARMSSGSAVLPNGQPKPFRSVKTGDFIYLNVTEEDRQKIAPFNYPSAEEKDMQSIRRLIAPFNYTSEHDVVQGQGPKQGKDQALELVQGRGNEQINRCVPLKKRPVLDQDNTVKVVPREAFDATIKRKGILKTRQAMSKRFRPEIDRREIAPFNYPQEVVPT